MKVQELLDLFNKQDDYKDIYKAFFAYTLGLEYIDPEVDKILNEGLEKYYNDWDKISFINEDVYNYVTRALIDNR